MPYLVPKFAKQESNTCDLGSPSSRSTFPSLFPPPHTEPDADSTATAEQKTRVVSRARSTERAPARTAPRSNSGRFLSRRSVRPTSVRRSVRSEPSLAACVIFVTADNTAAAVDHSCDPVIDRDGGGRRRTTLSDRGIRGSRRRRHVIITFAGCAFGCWMMML